MTTMVISDMSAAGQAEFSAELAKIATYFGPAVHKTKTAAVEGQVRTHCERIGIGDVQTRACIDVALALYRNGSSTAWAVMHGCGLADKIAVESAA